MNLAYVRVSSVDQNEARQIETLKKYDIEKWFIEKASAKDSCRLILQQLLDFAREGDTIYITDFSRLERSVIDLLHIVDRSMITFCKIDKKGYSNLQETAK